MRHARSVTRCSGGRPTIVVHQCRLGYRPVITTPYVEADPSTERRWIASRVVFFVGVTLIVVLSLALVTTAFFSWWGEGFGRAFAEAFGLDPGVETRPLWVYPVAVYVTYFVLPVVIFLPILLPLALTWKHPRRVVVFRRFHTPRESRHLRRIASRHFVRIGHVFTLADSQIRSSVFVRIPTLLGQVSFLHFRPRRITDAHGLIVLERLLDQRWRLNVNWLVSFRKIFPIATSDEYWQRAVGVLLEKAELVVMDVSCFSTSMAWEIAECHRRQLLSRTILLIDRDKAGQSETVLVHMDQAAGGQLQRALFAYGPSDVEQPEALRQRIADILTPDGTRSRPISRWQVFATTAATLTMSVGVASAGVALTAPYLFPDLTGRYSPFRSQALAAYRLTASTDILSRLIADDREWTLTMLRREASEGTSRMRGSAIQALRDVGDERDISLLIQLIGDRPIAPGQTDDDQLKRLIRWPDLERDALARLVARLGKPALRPLLQAMAIAPRLPFDERLYYDFIHVEAKGLPPAVFEPLLAAPNQAGRFVAALELAPLENDPRVIPILLEIVRAANPDLGVGLYAQQLLSGWPRNLAGLEWSRLDPFILGNDAAAERAARLVLDASDDAYLVRTLARAPDRTGQRLLGQLVERARSDESQRATRAHALLARASTTWTRSLLSDSDVAVRVRAAYAQAERGDASALTVVLNASKIRGTCETILFIRQECNPHLEEATDAVELMRARIRPPARVTADADAMTGLPQAMLESLMRLLLASGDERAMQDLFVVLRPSMRPEEAQALKAVSEQADASSLRRLVRAICDVGSAEGRTDLVDAWRGAGHPCAANR